MLKRGVGIQQQPRANRSFFRPELFEVDEFENFHHLRSYYRAPLSSFMNGASRWCKLTLLIKGGGHINK